jgi:crossover junction endodeoxyribonuclease RusA
MFYVEHGEDQMDLIAMLPYPVGLSVNSVWKRSRRGIYLNPKVKLYREKAKEILEGCKKFGDKKINLAINMFPPDKRPRDIDNILKVTLDTLQHADVFNNDSQIVSLLIIKKDPIPNGLIEISLWENQ